MVWNMIYLFIFGYLSTHDGAVEFLFVYSCHIGAGLSNVHLHPTVANEPQAVVRHSGALHRDLLLRAKDTTPLYAAFIDIGVVQGLFQPNISREDTFGGLVSGALATLLIIPFVKKPSPQSPPPQSP